MTYRCDKCDNIYDEKGESNICQNCFGHLTELVPEVTPLKMWIWTCPVCLTENPKGLKVEDPNETEVCCPECDSSFSFKLIKEQI